MPLDLFTVIKTGLDVAKTLKELKPKAETHDRHLQNDVTRALRPIAIMAASISSFGRTLDDPRK